MSPGNIEANFDAIRAALSDGDFTEIADANYGRVFQTSFVPCCIPLPVLIWLNPDSEGVFIRIIFPAAGAPARTPHMLERLNEINYELAIGSFVANMDSGEVRFKSAVFIGDTRIEPDILSNLIASAGDMVKVNFHAVVGAITGVGHAH